MALLITVPRINEDTLVSKLNRFASYSWATEGKIYIRAIDEGVHVDRLAHELIEYCQIHSIDTILVPNRVH
jgi:hypothetical protein